MIVVTGAFGFIGSNLVRELYNRGERNILLVDYKNENTYLKDISFPWAPADIFLKDFDGYCKKVTAIFHEGAISSTTETDWRKLFKQNVQYTTKLIYNCRERGIDLQYASSASVYGNPSIEDWNKKEKEINPLNLYGKSKSNIDYVVDLIINSSRPPRLLQGFRYFNVYGPNEDHKEDQASPYHKFSKQLKETGKIKLFEGSENFYRDFVPVETIIDIKLKALETKGSGIYDIGTGNPKSFYDVALEVGGSPSVIEWIPMPENLKEHYQTYSKANMDWLPS